MRTSPRVVDIRRFPDDRCYRLKCLCSNCRSAFLVDLSWGRDKPLRVECPECGSYAAHNWGGMA